MTDHPRLRRALSALAARDVAADPAGVLGRATVIRRRRMAFAGVGAVSVAAVLGVAVAMASTSPRESGFVDQLTPTPEPSVTSDPPAPTATATASVFTSPSPDATSAAPSESPSADVTYPPPGAKVYVTVVPASPVTGEMAEIRVRVTDTDGTWNGGSVEFGDGTSVSLGRAMPGCLPPTGPEPPYEARPTDITKTFKHLYRTGGTFTVTASAFTDARICGPSTSTELVKGTARAVVTGEDLPSNGPAEPTITIVRDGGEQNTVRVTLTMADQDGQLVEVEYDWGDGSAPVVRPLDFECENSPETGYPTGYMEAGEEHAYAGPGTYTLTVTLRSAGCDGTNEQEGTQTLEITL